KPDIDRLQHGGLHRYVPDDFGQATIKSRPGILEPIACEEFDEVEQFTLEFLLFRLAKASRGDGPDLKDIDDIAIRSGEIPFFNIQAEGGQEPCDDGEF